MVGGDQLSDAEALVRRVYAYVAYRIGPGAPAETVTRDVFTHAPDSTAAERDVGLRLIDAARRDLDGRFGLSERDRGIVALHLVGLDATRIAKLLSYRPEAAEVALGRALFRRGEEPRADWAEPRQEFLEPLVEEIRAARRPPSRRRMRPLAVAASAVALLAALSAVGALMAGENPELEATVVPRSAVPAPSEQVTDVSQARRGMQWLLEQPRTTPTARRATREPTKPQTADDAGVKRAAAAPAQKSGVGCDGLAERRNALQARHKRARARLIRRYVREMQRIFRGVPRWVMTDPESRRVEARIRRERSALQASHQRKWENLHKRLNRELGKLEAQRKRCDR